MKDLENPDKQYYRGIQLGLHFCPESLKIYETSAVPFQFEKPPLASIPTFSQHQVFSSKLTSGLLRNLDLGADLAQQSCSKTRYSEFSDDQLCWYPASRNRKQWQQRAKSKPNLDQYEEDMDHTLLRDIKAYKITFKIRVRVSRIWRPKKFKSNIYDGLHYILIDEQGHIIHAVIEESEFPYVSKKMEQGQVYDITNFHTQKPVSRCKIVDHEAEICFNESTNFEPVMDAFPPIPQYSC